ncbi:MAG: NDP-hexose 4-ketoreductase, partial [bacterium]|nr:NDP-hexose 4-ketoreductase [bacterium]
LNQEATDFLIDKGYNQDFGARPLRRAIEHHIEDPISEEILRGGYEDNTRISVSVKTEEVDGESETHLYFEGVKIEPSPDEEEAPSEHVQETTTN